MRDYGDWARNAVRVWMRQVLEDKGWSANEWATHAGTSPTNITRLLSPLGKTVPSVDTISKLAMVAGSQPPLYPGEAMRQQAADHANFCPECGYDLRQVGKHGARSPSRHETTMLARRTLINET